MTNSPACFRYALSAFSVPIGYDDFYLVVTERGVENSFFTKLQMPFKPFTGNLWVAIVAFILVSGVVIAVTDLDNEDDFPNNPVWKRVLTGFYFSIAGYTCGGPVHCPQRPAARLANIAFSYFILIALATYTGKRYCCELHSECACAAANLASILVAKNNTSTVNGIDDAIDTGHRICLNSFLLSVFKLPYPSARFVGVPVGMESSYVHSGKCDSMLVAGDDLLRMHAGQSNEQDCLGYERCTESLGTKGVLKGCELSVTQPDGGEINWADQESKWQCKRSEDGQPDSTRDCNQHTVGDLVYRIPLAMPIRRQFVTQMNEAIIKATETNLLKQLTTRYKEKTYPSSCTETVSGSVDDMSLPIDALFGTLFLCGALTMIALAWGVIDQRAEIAGLVQGNEDTTNDNNELSATDDCCNKRQSTEQIDGTQNILEALTQMEARLSAKCNLQMIECDETRSNGQIEGSWRTRQSNGESAVEIAKRIFERYDLDKSGTVSSSEEAEQITTNLLFKLGVPVSTQTLERELDILNRRNETDSPMAMDFEDYWLWFQNAFNKTHSLDSGNMLTMNSAFVIS